MLIAKRVAIIAVWVFGARFYPTRKTLAREPNPRKPLNPNCFILYVELNPQKRELSS